MAIPIRVLIIEDSESDAELLKHHLERAGFAVTSEWVENREALTIAINTRVWDVILSDFSLPGFDAFAALSILQETGKDIPFIIVSGTINEEKAIELLRLGASDYLMKDNLARLVPAIKRDMEEAKTRQHHREAEEDLKKSQERYKILFDQSPFGVLIVDSDTTLPVEFNETAHKQLGYSREEFYKIPISTFEALENPQEVKARIKHLYKTGSDEFDSLHRTKQGEIRSVHVILRLLDLDGKRLQHCIFQDITDQKKAEAALKVSESTLEEIFQTVDEGISYATPSGEVLSVNNAMVHILNIPRNEIIGKNILFLAQKLLSVKMLELIMPKLWDILKGNNIAPFEVEFQKKYLEVSSSFNKESRHIIGVIRDITIQKKAQRLLQEKEARLSAMVSNISDVIAILDVDSTIKYKSPNIEKFFGWKPEDLIGKSGFITVHPDDLARIQSLFETLLQSENLPLTLDYSYLCKDGSYRLVKLTATNLVKNPDINGILLNYQDITEQRKMELAKTHAEEKFRKAFITSPDSININRLHDGLYLDINEGFTTITGYTFEDVIGKTSLELNIWANPEDRTRLVEGLRKYGKVVNLEAPFRMKDGTIKTCLMSANIIDVNGETCILNITRDITERKKAEEAIRLRSAALNATVNAVTITDAEHRITWANQAFYDLTGFSENESKGQHLAELIRSGVHDQSFYAAIDQTIKSGRVWQGEIINRRKNGQFYTEEMTVTPIFDQDGRISNFISIKQDITDRKKSEEAIQLQSAALNAAATAVIITDANNRITWANKAFYLLTGYSEEESLSQKFSELIRSGVHDQAFQDNIDQTIFSGKVWQGEIINRRKNGDLYTEETTVTPVFGKDGKITHFITVKQDISEKKLSAEIMKSRLHLLEYAGGHSSDEVLQETLAEAEKLTGSLVGFYHFVDPDQEALTLQAWSRQTVAEFCKAEGQGLHYPVTQAGVWVDCIRERKPVIHNDYATLPHRKGLPPGHATIMREMVVPVFRGEKIKAVLGVGNKTTDYDQTDIETISLLADLAWDIAEKRINEIALQESEIRYRDLFENSPIPTRVEDMTEIGKLFESIRNEGVMDIRGYFDQHPEQVELCSQLVKIIADNKACKQFFGVSKEEEIATSLPFIFTDSSWPVFREELIALANGATHLTNDFAVLNSKNEERILSLNLSVGQGLNRNLSRVLVSFLDITDQKKAEDRIRAERELLQICNYASSGQELLHKLIEFFKNFTGCEAVGIRLQENGDFPYFETRDFPESFVKLENSLCTYDTGGELLRDELDSPILECMCGNILRGRFDPSLPFYTKQGSFWSGNISGMLASTSEADHQACQRNRCYGEGCESVALIPIRLKDRTFGLFQFKDTRTGFHSLEKIELLEKLVDFVAIALAKQETDEALAVSEQSFREIFNSTSEAIFIDDAETGQMIDVNETMLKMYGYENKEEVLAGSIGDLSVNQEPFTNERAKELVKKAVQEGPQVFDWLAKRRDGSVFWSEVSLTRSQIGGKNRVLAVIRDISTRKNTEEALLKSDSMLNEAQRLSKIGAWEWDIPTQTLIWSDEVYRIHDISKDEITNGSLDLVERSLNCYHPEDRPLIRSAFEQAVATGQPYELELRFISEQGEHKWVNTIGKTFLENGEVVRVAGNILDITERKQAEIALLESKAILEKAQKHAHLGSWTWNIQTNQLEWSDEMFRIFGLERETFTDSLEDVINYAIHPDDRVKVEQSNLAVITRSEPKPLEYRVIWPDKTVHFIWAEAGEIKVDPEGKPIQLSGIAQDITERKQAESVLRESEERIRIIFDTLAEGVALNEMVFNDSGEMVDYKILEVNNAFYDIALFRKDEVVVGNLATRLYGLDPQTIKEFWVNHNHVSGAVYTEFVSPLSKRVYGISTSPFKNNRFVTSFQDITELKTAEKSLKDANWRLENIIEGTNVGTWEWNIQTGETVFNEIWAQLIGYTLDELEPISIRTWERLTHPEDFKLSTELLERHFVGELPYYDIEYRMRHKDGHWIWVQDRGRVITHTDNGKPLMMFGTHTDITARKLAEADLRESETRFRSLFQNVQTVAVQGYAPDGTTQYWNEASEKLYGYTQQEAVGKNLTDLIIPPEMRLDIMQAIQWMRENRQTIPASELSLMRKDGSRVDVYSSHALVGKPDQPLELFCIDIDLTERKSMELALKTSLDEKEVLLREVHHRVKNNLASILGLLEMERQTTNDPAADTLLMELGNRIKSMATIHEKLYRSTNLSKIDFTDYLKSFISHLRSSMLPGGDVITRVEAHNVELSLDLAVPCGLIINELVTNALKYAFPQGKPGVPGAKKCEICVRMSVRGTAYKLTVADNGVGMPQDLDWRNTKSLGLRLITMLGEHQLGGKIALDRSAGTKFTLKFNPRRRE